MEVSLGARTARPRDQVRRGARGQAMLEMALVIPVALLVLFAIFDLGRAVYAFNTIANAARQASRLAVVDQKLAPIQQKAADEALALNIAPATVTVTYLSWDLSAPCTPLQVGCIAQVTVPYTYTAATPVIGQLVGSLNLSSTTRLPIERVYTSP